MKRKKTAEKNNQSAGASPAVVPFQLELARVGAIDDSISPEVIRGVGEATHKPVTPSPYGERAGDVPTEATIPVVKCQSKLDRILWKIHEERERNRDYRHQELMSLIKDVFGKSD